MSQFGNALTTVLSELKWSQTYFAEISGIQRTQVNRYARGTSSIDLTSLEKLLQVIPAPFNAQVLAAYLRDFIPDGAEGLVTLDLCGETVQESPPDLPGGLDPEFRAAIVRLALLARRHTEVRDVVLSIDRLMRTKRDL